MRNRKIILDWWLGADIPAPSVQTSNLEVVNITNNTARLQFTSGNGQYRIVLAKAGSAVNSNPVDATTYNANAAFGSGSQIGSGNYVLYKGTGSFVDITNINLITTVYHFRCYEFNGDAGLEKYLTTTASNNPISVDMGLMAILWNKTDNIQNAKIRLGYAGTSPNSGVWNNSTVYNPGRFVNEYSGSPLVYQNDVLIGTGELPPSSRYGTATNPNWKLAIGAGLLYPLGGSNFGRISIGWNRDHFRRIKQLEIGTLATTGVLNRRYGNYVDRKIGSSTTSIGIPTSHPSSRTVTVQAGLTITNGETVTLKNSATAYFTGTVTSYNSGTGQLDVSSTLNIGTGTLAVWDLYRGRPASDAPNTSGAGVNHYYAANNGEEIYLTFRSTGVRLGHTVGTNGKSWLFSYVSGPNSGSPPADVVVDTYAAAGANGLVTLIFQNLTPGVHVIKGVAQNSPNGASTNQRAYFDGSSNFSGDYATIQEIDNFDVFTPTFTIANDSDSFGEFAYRFRLNANPSDTLYWNPDHNGDRVNFRTSDSFIVDGVTIDTTSIFSDVNPYLFKFKDFTSFEFKQIGQTFHPQVVSPVSNYEHIHYVNRCGVLYKCKIDWLQACFISIGYNNMVFVNEWWDKMKTQVGNYYLDPADNTISNLNSADYAKSAYIFYATTGSAPAQDIALCQWLPNPTRDWRTDLITSAWIQNFSGAAGSKFYPNPYNNYVTTVGESMIVSGLIYFGNFPAANSNL